MPRGNRCQPTVPQMKRKAAASEATIAAKMRIASVAPAYRQTPR